MPLQTDLPGRLYFPVLPDLRPDLSAGLQTDRMYFQDRLRFRNQSDWPVPVQTALSLPVLFPPELLLALDPSLHP